MLRIRALLQMLLAAADEKNLLVRLRLVGNLDFRVSATTVSDDENNENDDRTRKKFRFPLFPLSFLNVSE